MIISRADIPTDVIVQYPNAFMKVPIANYLRELEIDPLPSQIAVDPLAVIVGSVGTVTTICS